MSERRSTRNRGGPAGAHRASLRQKILVIAIVLVLVFSGFVVLLQSLA